MNTLDFCIKYHCFNCVKTASITHIVSCISRDKKENYLVTIKYLFNDEKSHLKYCKSMIIIVSRF